MCTMTSLYAGDVGERAGVRGLARGVWPLPDPRRRRDGPHPSPSPGVPGEGTRQRQPPQSSDGLASVAPDSRALQSPSVSAIMAVVPIGLWVGREALRDTCGRPETVPPPARRAA